MSAEHRKTVSGIAEAQPDSRRVKFVVSTGDVDRDNDVVNPAGWQLDNYRRSPVVLWAHSHSELPVGKCVDIAVRGTKLVAVCEFAGHAFADEVYQLVKGGFLNATSVGFRALKWLRNEQRGGIDFVEQELLEFSVVPVPANQNALVAASAAGVDTTLMRRWAKQVLAADDDVLDIAEDYADVLDVSDATPEYLARLMNPALRAGLVGPESVDIDPRVLREAIREVVHAGLREAVSDAAARGVRMSRGRVD